MNDRSIPPIVSRRDNGLAYLEVLCQLFNAPFASIHEDLQPMALQLLAGLYAYPSIDDENQRSQLMSELDDLCEQYFPVTPTGNILDAAYEGFWTGVALKYGTQHVTVRGAYYQIRAEMIYIRAKWQFYTMGNPDDMVRAYRWRTYIVAAIDAAIGAVKLAVGVDIAGSASTRAIEHYAANKSVSSAVTAAANRVRSGGSPLIEALTKGRGLPALASTGGGVGIGGVAAILQLRTDLANTQREISAALHMRVWQQGLDEKYIDEINESISPLKWIPKDLWW